MSRIVFDAIRLCVVLVPDSSCRKPKIIQFRGSVTHTMGSSQPKLECKAIGYPEPRITWSPVNDKRQVIDPGTGTLTINDPRPTDARVYTCTAYNKCGMASSDTKFVIGEFLN